MEYSSELKSSNILHLKIEISAINHLDWLRNVSCWKFTCIANFYNVFWIQRIFIY